MKPLFKMAAFAGSAIGHTAKFGSGFASSVFKKTVSAARRTFDAGVVKKDVLIRSSAKAHDAFTMVRQGRVNKRTSGAIKYQYNRAPAMVRKQSGNGGMRGLGYVGGIAALGVGAVGMMSVGIMHGMNNAAKDILLERYMQDQRYSRNMLLQSRVGLAMGTSKMSRLGSTTGLSNSLSKTRHGASY